jgi:hypothetical protein
MTDESSALTRDDVRKEAREILVILDGSRHHQELFEASWRKLWQLVREADVAGLLLDGGENGAWHFSRRPGGGRRGVTPSLQAGNFILPIWPPEEPRCGPHLPTLLNWAGVPAPDGR